MFQYPRARSGQLDSSAKYREWASQIFRTVVKVNIPPSLHQWQTLNWQGSNQVISKRKNKAQKMMMAKLRAFRHTKYRNVCVFLKEKLKKERRNF
jgi:hypothetical protein